MANNTPGGGPKLSTQEILARARAEAAQNAGGLSAPAAVAPPAATSATPILATPPATPKPAAPKPAAGGKPKSTAEILAAARAEKAAAAAAAEAPAAPPAGAPATTPAKPAAKPAAGGAKPKTTAEILAALRAEKAGGAVAATPSTTAAKPAVTQSAAAKAGAEATVSTAGLSVEEMLAAVRPSAAPSPAASAKGAAASAAPKAAPPMPAKPVKAGGKKGSSIEERRGVLAVLASPFVFGWTALTGILGAWTLGLARFMLPNVLTEPPSKFKIGPPADYDLGVVSTKWVAQFGIWIVHTDQYQGKNLIYALASVCTHLGCTPSWLEGERKFKCPCHGSGFYITGVNFEGPAPRPLERVGIRLSEDGMLEVDKSLKFQEEMGQWNDASSFFEVTA